MLSAPNVTVVGLTVTIDWTRSFDLRSLLEEYSLEENLIQAYTGNKLSVTRPNREVGGIAFYGSFFLHTLYILMGLPEPWKFWLRIYLYVELCAFQAVFERLVSLRQ